MDTYLTGDGLLKTAIGILALAWAFNMIYTAIQNVRKEKERGDAPIRDLQNKITSVESSIRDMEKKFSDMCRTVNARVDDLERGVTDHTSELEDMHKGQQELCRGVQALLEHALHNGNEAEMRSASQSIGEWLRTR